MNVRIRRLRPDVPLPPYGSDGAAAFDLAASDDVVVPAGDLRCCRPASSSKFPKGCFWASSRAAAPRSSAD